MPFDNDHVVVVRRDDDTWELEHPLIYRGSVDTFCVPAGFVTDFASVPRIAVWLIPRFGRYTPAAIVHDYLCQNLPIPPADVDGVFRRIMREQGVPPIRRWLMWTGVRWGAVANPARRPGWMSTAPAVAGITVVALPLAVPMAAVAVGLAVYAVAELIATRGRHAGTVNT